MVSQFEFKKVVKYAVANLLYGLMVALGLVALIVPGIYLGIKYQYYLYFILEKDAGIFESFKLSANLTHGVKMQLFWFSIVALGVVILGAVAFVVGLLVAIPVVLLSNAYLYRKLAGQLNPVQTPIAPVVNQ